MSMPFVKGPVLEAGSRRMSEPNLSNVIAFLKGEFKKIEEDSICPM